MATYDGKVTIDTALDNSGFRRGINSIKGSFGGLAGVAGKLGLAISAAFAVKKVVEFGVECIELGSDVAEVQNVVDTAFGDMSDKMEDFAKTSITQFGMSKLAAKKAGSNFMSMAMGMGVASDAASDMAIGLTGLSGDVASFFNIGQDDAATKLKSVFTGETESLKEIGVVMTQTNLDAFALANGYGKTTSAMNQAELVALRYAYVMNSLSLAQGDFAKTQGGWANQTRILSMQWQEFMSIIGTALTTVLLPLVKALNSIVSAMIRAANAFNAAIQAIFGGSRTELSESGATAAAGNLATAADAVADSSGAAAAGQDDLADSTKAATAAAKKSLAAFDELNRLESGSGSAGSGTSGSAGGAGSAAGAITSSEIGNAENKLSKLGEIFGQLSDSFAKGLKLGWGDAGEGVQNILTDLQKIKASLREIAEDSSVAAAASRIANSVAETLGKLVGSVGAVGVSIGENLVGGISRYLEGNKDFLKTDLAALFDIGADISDMLGNTFSTIGTIFRSLGSEGGKELTAGLIGTVGNTLLGMATTFGQTLYSILNPLLFGPLIDNADKIRQVFANLFTVVAPFFEGVAKGISDFYSALNDLYQNMLRPVFDTVEKFLSDVLGENLDTLNDFLEKLTGTKDVLGDIGQALGWLVGGISAVAAAFAAVKVALGIFGAIQGAVSLVITAIGGIGTAFAGIGTILSGVMGTASLATGAVSATGVAVGLLSSPVAIVIAAIGALIAVGVLLYANWDTISTKASEFGSAVYETFYNLGQDVYNTMYNLGAKLEETVSGAGKWITGKWEEIKTGVGTTVETMRTDVETKWQALTTNTQTLLTGLQTNAREIWTDISTTASSIGSEMSMAVDGLWAGMCSGLQSLLSGLQEAARGIWVSISDTASGMVSGLAGNVQGLWAGMCSGLQSLMNGLQSMLCSVWSAIQEIVGGAVRGIVNTVKNMIQTIQNAISGILSALRSLGSKASGTISSAQSAVSRASSYSQSPATASLLSFSNTPIPALASGAVLPANKPFLAMVGDQSNGTNIEAPISTIQDAVANVMGDQLDAMMAGFEAVVAAIQNKELNAVIGDEAIYSANKRQSAKLAMING